MRKRLWLVISIMALITMLSVIYVARKPDIYQAGARVQVDLENNAALVGKTPYVFGPANDPVYFNTQLQILVSPGLMRRVVKTLDLEHNPNFFKGNSAQKRSTWQTIKKMAGFGSADPQPAHPQSARHAAAAHDRRGSHAARRPCRSQAAATVCRRHSRRTES